MAQGLCTEESKLRVFDADWGRGRVAFRKNSTDRPIRILTRSREADTLEVENNPEALAVLDQGLNDARLHEKLSDINDPPWLQ